MYALLDELIEAHHPELVDARIALAWCTSWKPDVDGHITLGKCRRASDLDRELAAFDFVLMLRRSFWQHPLTTDLQRRALLDHELCHAAVKYDVRGEPVVDERGRHVFRIRRHDLEEFAVIAERYGCWMRDLEQFAAALRRSVAAFDPCPACRDEGMPGWRCIDDEGVSRARRCACYLAWAESRAVERDELVEAPTGGVTA